MRSWPISPRTSCEHSPLPGRKKGEGRGPKPALWHLRLRGHSGPLDDMGPHSWVTRCPQICSHLSEQDPFWNVRPSSYPQELSQNEGTCRHFKERDTWTKRACRGLEGVLEKQIPRAGDLCSAGARPASGKGHSHTTSIKPQRRSRTLPIALMKLESQNPRPDSTRGVHTQLPRDSRKEPGPAASEHCSTETHQGHTREGHGLASRPSARALPMRRLSQQQVSAA